MFRITFLFNSSILSMVIVKFRFSLQQIILIFQNCIFKKNWFNQITFYCINKFIFVKLVHIYFIFIISFMIIISNFVQVMINFKLYIFLFETAYFFYLILIICDLHFINHDQKYILFLIQRWVIQYKVFKFIIFINYLHNCIHNVQLFYFNLLLIAKTSQEWVYIFFIIKELYYLLSIMVVNCTNFLVLVRLLYISLIIKLIFLENVYYNNEIILLL